MIYRKIVLLFLCVLSCGLLYAGKISGTITDNNGRPLPFASVTFRELSRGTTANNEGKYSIEVADGNYTLVVQYVGFARFQKAVKIGPAPLTENVVLQPESLSLNEVVVKSGGEDPAYEIIRQAIRKRKSYEQPLDEYTCEAYIKFLMKTRSMPKRLLGQKIEESDKKEMGVDSGGKGIIYLSESVTKIAYKKPDKMKLEVVSGRESGSNGYGFNFPVFINFYSNNVNVFSGQISKRGFISPIADGALNFYRYKFLGTFYEEGKEINKIQVTPRRNYEPCFSGIINITENDWRIHSLDLLLTKKSMIELVDTVNIRQIHKPVAGNVWRTQNQVVYFTLNIFGFDLTGNALNVYNDYNLKPNLDKKYFNNVVVKYDTAVNKRPKAYWDSIRPVPLEKEEVKDYRYKDSMYQYNKDSLWTKPYRDSMRHLHNRPSLTKLFWSGYSSYNYNPKAPGGMEWRPLLKHVQYNTVEGLVANASVLFYKTLPSIRKQIQFTPNLRYGFSNTHLNAWGTLNLNTFKQAGTSDVESFGRGTWSISGGKRVSQFNKEEPITPLMNEVYTLFLNRNYMKIYENYFVQLGYARRTDYGLRYALGALYEDRLPLDNTTDYSIIKYRENKFTPNYPFEILGGQFSRHQAVIAGVALSYQPGQRYIQYPNQKVSLGSKYPTFTLAYQKGFRKVLGSDVDFDKWAFTIQDRLNLKLKGELLYKFDIGGFLNTNAVQVQDYRHFNGNRAFLASRYVNSFQLAPYYANSTTAKFYATGHLEHHFNGLLTNKIPFFKKLNWFLVAGSNAFYVNRNNNYVEVFAGLENLFKILRVDVVASYLNGNKGEVGVRVGFGGLIGGMVGRMMQ
jgi:hypothetical protein